MRRGWGGEVMAGVDIIPFGCRLNAFESEIIRRAAAAAGLSDTVIVNTCAVTAEAERQARQAIRRARREHPHARIIVTGCAATLAPERYAAVAEVDVVLDNDAKLKAESYAPEAPTPTLRRKQGRELSEAASRARPRLLCDPPPQAGEGRVGAMPGRPGEGVGRARAYLQAQQGCDHRCTFCIIPYARGPSRSLPLDAIVAGARLLGAEGAREVVLSGVDLTASGAGLVGGPSLRQMVRHLRAGAPALARPRVAALDPTR